MNDCVNGDVRDRLPELVNGRLNDEALLVVRAHLVDCGVCASEVLLLERTRALLIVATPRIDTAAIVQRLPGPKFAERRRSFDWRIAASIAVLVVGGGSVAVMRDGWSSRTAADSVAIATGKTQTPTEIGAVDGSELSVSDDLSDLTDEQLRALLGKVEGIEALPAAEARTADPLTGVVPLETSGTRDPSGAA